MNLIDSSRYSELLENPADVQHILVIFYLNLEGVCTPWTSLDHHLHLQKIHTSFIKHLQQHVRYNLHVAMYFIV